MKTHVHPAALVLAAFLATCLAGIAFANSPAATPSTATATTQRPNVLYIIVDDLNDYTPLHAYPGVRSPNLDLFATEALTFRNSHCAAPICVPSRTALFSGVAPWRSGAYYNSPSTWQHRQMAGIETLPETFKRSGYLTFGAGKLFHNGPDSERMAAMWDKQNYMNGGFGPWKPNPDGTSGNDFSQWQAWTGPDTDFPDVRNTDAAISFLGKEHDQPFLLMLGIYRPHTPLTAPKRFFDLYDPDALPVPPAFRADDLDDVPTTGRAFALNRNTTDPINDLDYRERLRAYLACITFMDWNVGRMLDALRASPYADNTIVIFSSDHSMHYGVKYRREKSTLWNQGTNAALMMKVPSMTPSGAATAKAASLLDLYPTLIDLCSLPAPPHKLDGRSLRPILSNPQNPDWSHPVLISHGAGPAELKTDRWHHRYRSDGIEELYDLAVAPSDRQDLVGGTSMHQKSPLHATLAPLRAASKFAPGNLAIVDESYRYIRYGDGGEELYHLPNDPYEWNNLADHPDHAAAKRRLAAVYPSDWAHPIHIPGWRMW